jgi:hypothetical protein
LALMSAIAERLAKSDPGNRGWQRDLSASYNKVGGVQEAHGDLAAALQSYSDSLAIAERLAKSDPGNMEWQRDLSVSYERAGGVQEAQGDRGERAKRRIIRPSRAARGRPWTRLSTHSGGRNMSDTHSRRTVLTALAAATTASVPALAVAGSIASHPDAELLRLGAEFDRCRAAQAEIERLRLIIRKLQRNQFGRRAAQRKIFPAIWRREPPPMPLAWRQYNRPNVESDPFPRFSSQRPTVRKRG